MSYRIVVDSCGELTDEMKKSGKFVTAPLTINIDGEVIVDDETFHQASFLKKVADSPNCPKSSCPSPENYMDLYDCDAEHVYAVTLSSELSGSYNSAVLGKRLYEEERGEKKIYVFNSRSASVGETLIAKKIQECEEKGMEFEEVIKMVEKYIAGMHTYFTLESLETLRKNGRLTGIKALVASALNIKPYMGATPDGKIIQLGQARGMKKALEKMVDVLVREARHTEDKTLAIAHCNCRERAMQMKELVEEKMKVKEIIVLDTAGISSMYANDGGIIMVV